MELHKGSERRLHPRIVVAIEAHIACKNSDDASQTVLVHDISLKGMAIRAQGLSLRVGDRICLCLSGDKLNCGSEHVIEASVVNLRDELAGLQFDSVGVLILKDLQQLLREGRKR